MSAAIDFQMTPRRPFVVGVGGLTSNVGKTTLLCELLQRFPGWEAIKTTRGHYRSCGKNPHACCVSDMLDEEPVIHSERALTEVGGKDTGRYWEAGAANVHWLIATDAQVEEGARQAISRVRSAGVFIEGNSFTASIKPEIFIMVVRPDLTMIKKTAREALTGATAIYVSGEGSTTEKDAVLQLLQKLKPDHSAPLFSTSELDDLVEKINDTFFIFSKPTCVSIAS